VNSEILIQATGLLKQVLAIPSLSREETQVCSFLQEWFREKGFQVFRKHNNIWIKSFRNENLPTILMNSHLDTVKPSSDWTFDPYLPEIHDFKIYGLGSNDAGGSLIAMIFSFLELHELTNRDYNLILVLSSEEEISGVKGISSIIEDLGKFDLAIIGEPTEMRMAVSERGLIVLDCIAHGRAGHAAHKNGENAIMKAFEDIAKLENMKFDKVSEFLGEVGICVTQIEAGTQHNVIPDICKFVVDVRTNEHYSNEEILKIISSQLNSEVIPRSMRLASSSLSMSHPLVKKAREMGIETFGSKTLSDQAVIPGPSVKIGPGISERSHQADEFIFINEIEHGIDLYIKLLTGFKLDYEALG
jgi:acetylornithine deacetylase